MEPAGALGRLRHFEGFRLRMGRVS